MITTASIAFKEWACVVEALATGEQILILRKGGIHEKAGKFDVRHPSFFLFPTYEHQKPEDLNEQGQKFLKGVTKSDFIPIRYFAEVVADQWVDDFGKLQALAPFHVWSGEAVRKRFEWGKSKGLFAMVVRVYKLASESRLPNLPAYGGCRSWVELNVGATGRSPLLRSEMQPVLTDEAFETRLKSLNLL